MRLTYPYTKHTICTQEWENLSDTQHSEIGDGGWKIFCGIHVQTLPTHPVSNLTYIVI